jgi:hypothetical protein
MHTFIFGSTLDEHVPATTFPAPRALSPRFRHEHDARRLNDHEHRKQHKSNLRLIGMFSDHGSFCAVCGRYLTVPLHSVGVGAGTPVWCGSGWPRGAASGAASGCASGAGSEGGRGGICEGVAEGKGVGPTVVTSDEVTVGAIEGYGAPPCAPPGGEGVGAGREEGSALGTSVSRAPAAWRHPWSGRASAP